MFCRTLLPADAVIEKVGGPGKEFWAAGRNWDLENRRGLTAENLAMIGRWRLEVSPGSERKEDCFLHVIQVGDQKLDAMDKVERIAGRRRGCRIAARRKPGRGAIAASGDLHSKVVAAVTAPARPPLRDCSHPACPAGRPAVAASVPRAGESDDALCARL